MKKVITYGTFDLFHTGHLRLLQRLRALGDYLVVAVSTDEFNTEKGKTTIINFDDRCEIVKNISCVDEVIAENSWNQKRLDILDQEISVFGMGHDWTGKFDNLRDICEVVYLPRTEGISSSDIKEKLYPLGKPKIHELKKALDLISSIAERFD